MASVLLLTQKAEVKSVKLSNTKVSINDVKKYFKKKSEPEVLGTYNYKGLTLFLLGYTTGKAGTENKHEFPPPHDTTLAFGDIMLIASKDEHSFENPIIFKMEDYETFYSKAFGGFDDLDDDDEDDDEEFIEEEIEENEIIENEEEDETFDKHSYVSEEEVEVVVKKEKKKKLPVALTQISIHPDKQLKSNSEKNILRQHVQKRLEILFNKELTKKEVATLEQELYEASLHEADSKHIIKDWSIKQFNHLYKSIVRKIVSNLYPKSYVCNSELLQKYKTKQVSLKDISSMNHYYLYESKWREHIEHQKNIEKLQIEGNKSMATDQFLCTRCYKRECTYYEMQTRSADEPMTIFINCLNCGKKWRQ